MNFINPEADDIRNKVQITITVLDMIAKGKEVPSNLIAICQDELTEAIKIILNANIPSKRAEKAISIIEKVKHLLAQKPILIEKSLMKEVNGQLAILDKYTN